MGKKNDPLKFSEGSANFMATGDTSAWLAELENAPEPTGIESMSTIQKLGRALGKVGGVGKLATIHALEDITGVKTEEGRVELGQLMDSTKVLEGVDVRHAIEKTTGMDITLGEEGSQTTPQRVLTWVEDLALDIALDPLTYLTGGIAKLAGLGIKGKMAIGAGVGASTINADDNIGSGLMKVAGGAAIAPVAINRIKKIGGAIATKGEKVIDDFILMGRPELQAKIAKEGVDSSVTGAMKTLFNRDKRLASVINAASRDLMQPFSSLTPSQIEDANKLLKSSMEEIISLRNYATRNASKVTGQPVGHQALNFFTKESNTLVGKRVDLALAARGDDALTVAIGKYRDANRKTILDLNKATYGNDKSKYIMPIDFHIPDILPEEALGKLGKVSSIKQEQILGFIKRNRDTVDTGNLSLVQRRELYSNRLAQAYSTTKEKQAQQLINSIRNELPTNDLAKNVSRSLTHFDTYTNFLKTLHLTTTHTWVQNNYADNVLRAYMAGGSGNAYETLIKSNPLQLLSLHDNMFKDMFKFSSPKLNYSKKLGLSNPEIQHALDSGLIQSGFFKDIQRMTAEGYDLTKAKVGKVRADELLKKAEKRGAFVDGFDKFTGLIGQTGSAVESVAKLITYKNHAKTLIETDLIKTFVKSTKEVTAIRSAFKNGGIANVLKVSPNTGKTILDEATKFTFNVFFDYQNLRPFEQLVMKRIFPYYTFFSRNAMFYLDQLTSNPTKLNNILKTRSNIGTELTDRERKETPPWLLEAGARKIGNNKGGFDVMSFPNMSLIDAISTMFLGKEGLSKINPLLKTPVEVLGNIDMFLGGAQYPSSTRSGKKPVFRSALPFKHLGLVEENDKGGLYTTNDFVQAAVNIKSNLLPTPLIDNILGTAHDISSERKTTGQAMFNLSPFKQRTINKKQRQFYKNIRKE